MLIPTSSYLIVAGIVLSSPNLHLRPAKIEKLRSVTQKFASVNSLIVQSEADHHKVTGNRKPMLQHLNDKDLQLAIAIEEMKTALAEADATRVLFEAAGDSEKGECAAQVIRTKEVLAQAEEKLNECTLDILDAYSTLVLSILPE
jgi:hypothetical protein